MININKIKGFNAVYKYANAINAFVISKKVEKTNS